MKKLNINIIEYQGVNFITTTDELFIGDLFLSGDSEGGSNEVFGLYRYQGGEKPYGYCKVLSMSPLIENKIYPKYIQ